MKEQLTINNINNHLGLLYIGVTNTDSLVSFLCFVLKCKVRSIRSIDNKSYVHLSIGFQFGFQFCVYEDENATASKPILKLGIEEMSLEKPLNANNSLADKEIAIQHEQENVANSFLPNFKVLNDPDNNLIVVHPAEFSQIVSTESFPFYEHIKTSVNKYFKNPNGVSSALLASELRFDGLELRVSDYVKSKKYYSEFLNMEDIGWHFWEECGTALLDANPDHWMFLRLIQLPNPCKKEDFLPDVVENFFFEDDNFPPFKIVISPALHYGFKTVVEELTDKGIKFNNQDFNETMLEAEHLDFEYAGIAWKLTK